MAFCGMHGGPSVLRCLQCVRAEGLPEVVRYGIPQVWDMAQELEHVIDRTPTGLMPHPGIQPNLRKQVMRFRRRAEVEIDRTLGAEAELPTSVRACRQFATSEPGAPTEYHSKGMTYRSQVTAFRFELHEMLRTGTATQQKLQEWEAKNEAGHDSVTGVDMRGRTVLIDRATAGDNSQLGIWRASGVGDMYRRMRGGHVKLRGAISTVTKGTSLTRDEATLILKSATELGAYQHHMEIGKEIDLLHHAPTTKPIRIAYECAGIGGDIEGGQRAAALAGVETKVVFVSEKDQPMREELRRRLGQGADAPFIGARAGNATGGTDGTRVDVVHTAPPCPPASGFPVGDTRNANLEAVIPITQGGVPFTVVEGVAGSESQEPMRFLRDTAEACGGTSIVVSMHAKDLGIPMVCHRVWCILMSAAVAEHEDELRALLDRPPMRRSEPLSKWFEDRTLSSELVIRSDHKVVIFPRNAWVMGSDDAPTRIGALTQRGVHVAHIYEGGPT